MYSTLCFPKDSVAHRVKSAYGIDPLWILLSEGGGNRCPQGYRGSL